MEWVPSSSQEQIPLHDIGVWQEMIGDIANKCVNKLLSIHCHIGKSGYTSPDASKQYPNNSKDTLEC